MTKHNLRNKIETFDIRFNDTAADSRAFAIVLKSEVLTCMIISYFSHNEESFNDFRFRISRYAIESMNQIYKPYGRIVRNEAIIHDYFDCLLDSLIEPA